MSTTPTQNVSSAGTDNEGLFGQWYGPRAWRDRLQRKAVHKALNIPEDFDDMNNVGNRSGMGWKEIVAIGAFLLAALAIWRQPDPQAQSPSDAAYEVQFFDGEGNEIQLDRWTAP